jgi:hypothetical protein
MASAMASAATWWPSATVFSQPARIGLAANSAGAFLLVDGRSSGEAALCGPAAPAFALGGPEPVQHGTVLGTGGSVLPGSPSFEPDGRSAVLFLTPVLHSEFVELYEGSSSALATISPAEALGASILSTDVFVTEPAVKSATGARGNLAVADVPDTSDITQIAIRLAGSTAWSHEALPGYSSPKALAVDGLGDTTVLANTFMLPGPTETASAYFARPGKPFTPLAVPGNYFTAIASDAAGRSAIAGYTSSGPDGSGLYLSRRESPNVPFGPAVLLSSQSSDPRPQLAYDAAGTLTVAWNEGGSVAVATAGPREPVEAAQVLSAPGTTVASDEQLSVDAAGEAILAWSGAHEEFSGPGEGGAGKLNGVPAPVFAAVRHSGLEPFQAVEELASSALYSQGLYQTRADPEAREADAIGSGRAMVAWLEQGPSGPEVKTALYADHPGCATPTAAIVSPPPSTTLSPPAITAASLTNRRFRVSKRGTAISARRVPLGTAFRFTLSTAANLRITLTRPDAGLRRGHSCLAPTVRLRRGHAKRCTRTLIVGALSRIGEPQGTGSIAFSGRLGHRALPAGAYEASLVASDAAGRSIPVTLRFTVVR